MKVLRWDGSDFASFFLVPKGRIKRLEFLLGNVFLFCSFIGVMLISLRFFQNFLFFIPVLIFILFYYSFIVLGIKRIHDINLSGWFYLLMYVPIVNLVFLLILFFKGSVDPNKFGSNPSLEKISELLDEEEDEDEDEEELSKRAWE